MYLHEDREMFRTIVEQVAEESGKNSIVIEKDYYVTMILRLLSEQLELCVFKGGTSLSKGFHVINRFSEDIDITFNEHIGESRRKKLKHVVLKGISEKLEMALGSYAFPTQSVEIHNFIGDYLENRDRKDIAEQFFLDRFFMNLQSLERTYIDKIFALCDYYMQGKSKRYSRHLYDIYKLTPFIAFDDEFALLVKEVRNHRAQMSVCPSADAKINIPALITEFCDNSFYEEDYHSITSYFTEDFVPYEDIIDNMKKIIKKISF